MTASYRDRMLIALRHAGFEVTEREADLLVTVGRFVAVSVDMDPPADRCRTAAIADRAMVYDAADALAASEEWRIAAKLLNDVALERLAQVEITTAVDLDLVRRLHASLEHACAKTPEPAAMHRIGQRFLEIPGSSTPTGHRFPSTEIYLLTLMVHLERQLAKEGCTP